MNNERGPSLLTLVSVFVAGCLIQVTAIGQSTQTLTITSPLHALFDGDLGAAVATNPEAKVYSDGTFTQDAAAAMIDRLNNEVKEQNGSLPADQASTLVPTDKPIIIHLVRFSNANHTALKFQQWYLYIPSALQQKYREGFYLQSKADRFKSTALPGVSNFGVLYIHLNYNLSDPNESLQEEDDPSHPGKKKLSPNPNASQVSYTVGVTQAQTQFIQDLKTILQIAGFVTPSGLKAASFNETLRPGYWAYADINSKFDTATITVTPAYEKGAEVKASAKPSNSTTAGEAFSPNTYSDEGPTYIGLSVAVPVNSYSDVTYNSTSHGLVPQSTSKKNAYGSFDVYYPPTLPSLASFRYIPHPFVALPFSGKIFYHPMLGLAVGTPWVEVYGGAVFDREDGSINGVPQKTTVKWSAGIKISVSGFQKLLSAGTSKTKN